MLAHEWIRPALGLSEDAPYRFDFYAQEIEKLKADRKRRGEPVPKGWKLVPETPTSKQIVHMACQIKGADPDGWFRTDGDDWPKHVDAAERAYKWALSEAPQPAEPVKNTCKKCNGTGVESTRFHGVWPNGEECLEPIKCDQCDGFGTTSAAEPVNVDHGETRVNIGLEAETGSDLGGVVDHGEAEPVKVPSDADILDLWTGDPTHSRPVMGKNKVIAFARALLARYGQNPTIPAGWQLVPKDPTEEMLAATSWPNCAGTDYKHMLAAAPEPPCAL